jgi:bifunctional DNA-binding transcriptional regulator/antitoxin component of YhaV-PrlF toxin-antitoxin module
MAGAGKLTTRVSAKGQVILPKVIRQRRKWDAGGGFWWRRRRKAYC